MERFNKSGALQLEWGASIRVERFIVCADLETADSSCLLMQHYVDRWEITMQGRQGKVVSIDVD